MPKALTHEEFIRRSNEIHNHKYDYSLTPHISLSNKIKIICPFHGEFLQNAKDHLQGHHGCQTCGGGILKTAEQFIKECKIAHNNYYDYSLIEYINSSGKIKIICPLHGLFEQIAGNHLCGHRCEKCARQKQSESKILSKDVFIQRALSIHGEKYDYSISQYTGLKKKIKIICPNHGIFEQNASSHLTGNGCPKCVGLYRRTQNEFIEEAKYIHKNFYDYSKVVYLNVDTKVIIICPRHGEFLQSPYNHLKGGSCRHCGNNVSKPEIEWLDSLDIPDNYRQKTLIINKTKIKADAYNPDTNTIYEFWGDFWHGNLNIYNSDDINPKNKLTYGKLFQITQNKRQLILENGYNLIEIWCSEWNKIKKEIICLE